MSFRDLFPESSSGLAATQPYQSAIRLRRLTHPGNAATAPSTSIPTSGQLRYCA
jgi:hypothetical protein